MMIFSVFEQFHEISPPTPQFHFTPPHTSQEVLKAVRDGSAECPPHGWGMELGYYSWTGDETNLAKWGGMQEKALWAQFYNTRQFSIQPPPTAVVVPGKCLCLFNAPRCTRMGLLLEMSQKFVSLSLASHEHIQRQVSCSRTIHKTTP